MVILATEAIMKKQASADVDMEKSNPGGDYSVDKVPVASVDPRRDPDNESEDFQAGVKRVRAVTSIWSNKTLWTMFAM